MRVFEHIDLDHVPRLVQEHRAALAQVPKMQSLAGLAVLLRHRIDRRMPCLRAA